mmetsp:Transcript_57992/g.186287  ORF Transcript_57992/g.186287 Transcript_57992/m.186287 type:complete len:465 (-) Transcript_57992:227-1621(-)
MARTSRCCTITASSVSVPSPEFATCNAFSICAPRVLIFVSSWSMSASLRRAAARIWSASPLSAKTSASSPGYFFSICIAMKSTSVPGRSPCDIFSILICERESMAKPSARPRGVPPLRWLPAKSVTARRCRILSEVSMLEQPRATSLSAFAIASRHSWKEFSKSQTCRRRLKRGTSIKASRNSSAVSQTLNSSMVCSFAAFRRSCSSSDCGRFSSSSSTWSLSNLPESMFLTASMVSAVGPWIRASITQICRRRCSCSTRTFLIAGTFGCSWACGLLRPLGSSAKRSSSSAVSMAAPSRSMASQTVSFALSKRKGVQKSFFTCMPGFTSGFRGSTALATGAALPCDGPLALAPARGGPFPGGPLPGGGGAPFFGGSPFLAGPPFAGGAPFFGASPFFGGSPFLGGSPFFGCNGVALARLTMLLFLEPAFGGKPMLCSRVPLRSNESEGGSRAPPLMASICAGRA